MKRERERAVGRLARLLVAAHQLDVDVLVERAGQPVAGTGEHAPAAAVVASCTRSPLSSGVSLRRKSGNSSSERSRSTARACDGVSRRASFDRHSCSDSCERKQLAGDRARRARSRGTSRQRRPARARRSDVCRPSLATLAAVRMDVGASALARTPFFRSSAAIARMSVATPRLGDRRTRTFRRRSRRAARPPMRRSTIEPRAGTKQRAGTRAP